MSCSQSCRGEKEKVDGDVIKVQNYEDNLKHPCGFFLSLSHKFPKSERMRID